jgi:hypothetical protein
MQTYDKANAQQFARELYSILRNFKGSPLTAESMYYLQLELDNLLLEWKLRMGFLPEVEGDYGTGTLKRLVIKQDGTSSILVTFEIDEDADFARKRNAVAQELMDMPGGLLENGNEPS